jgi:integrase
MEINFTKRKIESLPTPKTGRALYHDTQVRGLVLTVQPSGERAFAWYRKVRRYPTWKTLGRFPDLTPELARGMASKANSNLAEGKDPFEDPGLTFGAAFERYVSEHLSTKKRPERAMAGARAHLRHLGKWLGLPLNQLRSDDVTRLHGDLKARLGMFTANRMLQAVKASINWAIEKKLFAGPNPAAGLGIFKEPKRERYLEPNELPRLFKQLNDPSTSDDLRDFVSLGLFTGARRGDVARMRWPDIHLSATGEQFWTVSAETKSGKPYNIALAPPAVRILAERKRRNGHSEWVFPSTISRSGHIEDPKRAWTRLRKKAGLTDLRFHDLRRTLGSWQAGLGSSMPIIAKSLGHKPGSAATEIYSQLALDPVRASVNGAVKAMLSAGKKRR